MMYNNCRCYQKYSKQSSVYNMNILIILISNQSYFVEVTSFLQGFEPPKQEKETRKGNMKRKHEKEA